MLSTEQMGVIAEQIGTTADEFAKAISDKEEIALELPKGRFLTIENEAVLLDNHGKKKYDEGKSKQSKDVLGNVKQDFELEGDNFKDVFANFKSKILSDAEIEPNKKLEDANNSILALQKTVTDRENEYKELQNSVSKRALEQRVLSLIPANSMGLENRTILSDMRANGFDVSEVDGVLTVTKNGTIQKDSLQNPEKFEDLAAEYLKGKNWLKEKKDGRGGRDEGGSSNTIKSMEDFHAYIKAKGINPHGQEALSILVDAKKNTNFK